MISTEVIIYAATEKSLTHVNGRPAVAHLVEAISGCNALSTPIVICGSGIDSNCVLLAPSGSESDDLLAGIGEARNAGRCLVMAGDMPLVTPEALTDLLEHAPDADIVYPVVARTDVEAVFPGRRVSYLTAQDGQYTGSSCLLFRPEAALSRRDLIASLLQVRKDPGAIVRLIGPWLGLKLALSKPPIAEIASMLSETLDLDCRVFLTHYPELLFSLDSPSDLTLAASELS